MRDDRILSATRLVALVVLPFLLAAASVLFFSGESFGERFAWPINPALTAFFVGSGYLGGAYFFARVVVGRRWHHVAAGLLPVAAYTASMLLATLLHWDRFDQGHFPFQVWLVLYVVTPVALPLVWARNRRTGPGPVEPDDAPVPAALRRGMALAGSSVLVAAVILFVWPDGAITIWPWTLSPLTARVLAGWHVLLGSGALTLANDPRWSAWRVPLQSITLWQVLVLVSMLLRREDLGPAGMWNWFLAFVIAGVLAVVVLYIVMERRRGQAAAWLEESTDE